MPWRRLTSFSFGSSPPPRINFLCLPTQCCNINPWVRTRWKRWTGSSKSCGLNIQSYDGAAAPGIYASIKMEWTARWERLGSTIKTCAQQVTISAPSPSNIKVSETCGASDVTDPEDCDAPTICATAPPNCSLHLEDYVYTGQDAITEAAIASHAAGSATETLVQDWTEWAQGIPNIIAGMFATDNRGSASASYRREELEIEVRGQVRPFLIQWRDTITNLSPGSGTSTEDRQLEITGPGVYLVKWEPGPDQSRNGGQGMVSIEY